jgi:hypothetical protein
MQCDQIQDMMRDQPILGARGRLLSGSYLSAQPATGFATSRVREALASQGYVVIPRAFQIILSARGGLPRPQSWLLLSKSAEEMALGLE